MAEALDSIYRDWWLYDRCGASQRGPIGELRDTITNLYQRGIDQRNPALPCQGVIARFKGLLV